LPGEMPPIEDFDDVISFKDAAEWLDMKPATIRKHMRGAEGKPPLPYVRLTRTPRFSKRQLAWWLNQVQQMPDTMMVNVRRARREGAL
jgi:hypothetical protein